MPILKNTARQITESVRLAGGTDGPYVASTWPNDATARMWYSKDGGTPVAVIPTRIDPTTGRWLLSVATMTSSVWDCDELTVFWEGTAIAAGHSKYYPEAHYTSVVAGRIDEAVSAPKTLTTSEKNILTADSTGVSTLLTRVTGAVPTLQQISDQIERIGGFLDLVKTRILLAIPGHSAGSSSGLSLKSDVTSASAPTVSQISDQLERSGGLLALTKEAAEAAEAQTANSSP